MVILYVSNLHFPGLPESVVAAALSRIGYKVLHLDRYIHTNVVMPSNNEM